MGQLRYAAIKAAFDILAVPPIPTMIRARSKCRGVIFTLHRVLPEAPRDFAPNAILQVTPAFLAQAIDRVRALGLDIVSMDEALRRLEAPEADRSFVVFSFDDAYRDNLEYALPVLREKQCPFTLYVPTALVDGKGEVWWQALEDMIASRDHLSLGAERFATASHAEKQTAYDTLYWRMRLIREPERVALLRDIASACGFDLFAHCRTLIMDWSELGTFVDEPLCTIGAHTVRHWELSKLTEGEVASEIAGSMGVLKERTGIVPVHLSYPIGHARSAGLREFEIARKLGLRSAVTTRPGGLYAHHRDCLTSLPRISLNGLFQKRRYVDVLATGAIFSAMGRLAG